MKKVLSVVLAVALCASLASFAMASGFVDSITYKDEPGLRAVAMYNGAPVYGVISENGNPIAYLDKDDIVIIPVAKIKDAPVAESVKTQLLDIYAGLAKGTAVLPYEKIEGIDADKMVVRDLFEVYFSDGTDISKEGVTARVTFNVGVETNAVVAAMSYVNGEWVPALSTVVNADGSVSCTFEDICPVVIAVQA